MVEDAYVPRERLDNPALANWFNETDAWWFDNVRFNAEKLGHALQTRDRFDARHDGRRLRAFVFGEHPKFARAFVVVARLPPVRRNSASLSTTLFVARPATRRCVPSSPSDITPTCCSCVCRFPYSLRRRSAASIAWREEWLQGGDDFWEELEKTRAGKLGSRVQSKQQYLGLVEDLLHTAAHIPAWAIAHTENGFISTDELVETVSRVRNVDAVYSKDFSDLLGVRAAIITARN